jgi:hypothetical protein
MGSEWCIRVVTRSAAAQVICKVSFSLALIASICLQLS